MCDFCKGTAQCATNTLFTILQARNMLLQSSIYRVGETHTQTKQEVREVWSMAPNHNPWGNPVNFLITTLLHASPLNLQSGCIFLNNSGLFYLLWVSTSLWQPGLPPEEKTHFLQSPGSAILQLSLSQAFLTKLLPLLMQAPPGERLWFLHVTPQVDMILMSSYDFIIT